MNLSLISQTPLAASTQSVLAALQHVTGQGDYFSEVRLVEPSRWRPDRQEAAILLLDADMSWPEFAWQCSGEAFGLPVLPLLVRGQDQPLAMPEVNVQDPRFYFVSNGIALAATELADPACSRVLLSKLGSYLPLLSRLILLRQRQPAGLLN